MVAQEKLEKITFVTIKSELKNRDTQKELYNTVALKNNHEAQRPSIPFCFTKNVFSRDTVKLSFFFLTSYIFSEKFIKIHQVVQKIWKFCSSILTIFFDFFIFPCYEKN